MNWKPWLLLLPALLLLALAFLYPIGKMLLLSLFDPSFTLRHYERLFGDPSYLKVLWVTFRIAISVTVCTLIIGYPLAYYLSQIRPKVAGMLMIFVVVPYFTSVLVRTYAWTVLLGTDGVINQALMKLHLIDHPLRIMYTGLSVLIGMTYVLLPYMVLALFSVMKGIDVRLLSAAESLGASRISSFVRVFIPLSMPGIAAGGLLVFILSIGFFITPALMGSPQDGMISMLIESQVETYFDWNFASALASVLLFCTILLFVAYERFVGLKRLFESKL